MAELPFIPYFTTSRYRVETMAELSSIKPGEKVADLGSGDGRIAIAFAQKGAIVTGFELDETLLLKSRLLIQEAALQNSITIHQKDFWKENVSAFDIITIYPMPDIMEKLEEKLRQEAKPGARILTNYYPLPTWELDISKDHIYLYRKT